MIISELLTKLGFTADVSALNSFIGKIDLAKIKIFAFAAVIEETARRATQFFSESLENIDSEGRFAQQIGVTVEQLQKLQFAATQSGGSAQDLDASMRNLSKSIFEASEGMGSAIEVFGRLGISTVANGQLRSTVDILGELADRIKTINPEEQQDFAAKVGISNSTLLLLQKGSAGIRELSDEAAKVGIYSEEDAKKAEAYTDSLRKVTQAMTVLKNQIAITLAPVFTQITDSLTKWIEKNKEFLRVSISAVVGALVIVLTALVGIIGAVVSVLQFLLDILEDVGHAIMKVVDFFGGFKNILQTLSFAAIFTLIANMSKIVMLFNIARDAVMAFGLGFHALMIGGVVLTRIAKGFELIKIAIQGITAASIGWTAAIIILALVAQDIWGYFHGMDSVTGRFIKRFPALGGAVIAVAKLIGTLFVRMVEGLETVFSWIDKIAGFIGSGLAKAGNFLLSALRSNIHDIMATIISVFDFFDKKLAAFEKFYDNISNKVKSILPGNHTATISPIISNGSRGSNSSTVNNAHNSTSHHSTFNIHVNGHGGSAQSVVDAVKKGIYDATRQANRNNYSPAVL